MSGLIRFIDEREWAKLIAVSLILSLFVSGPAGLLVAFVMWLSVVTGLGPMLDAIVIVVSIVVLWVSVCRG